jgi:hypothetical protein
MRYLVVAGIINTRTVSFIAGMECIVMRLLRTVEVAMVLTGTHISAGFTVQ